MILRALILISLNVFGVIATAQDRPWSTYLPYVPEQREYQAELGAMWEDKSLYWAGVTFGQHMGRCRYFDTDKCQQFLDYHVGWGSREGTAVSMGLLSWRWQYVRFPEPFSPSFRILLGAEKISDDTRDRFHLAYGLGIGWTATLHKNLDMKIEGRVGDGDHPWSMALLSFSIKADEWVADFAHKVKKLGEDTWDVSGKIIKGTISAPADVVDWLKGTEDKRTTEDKSSGAVELSPQPSPKP